MTEAHLPPAIDPDHVPETLCIGRFSLSPGPGPLVTLTFTNVRNQSGPLINDNKIVPESVVRARIVTTVENLVALRDLLTNSIQETPTTSSGGGTYKLN